jgi:hypothetical protein
MKHRAKRGIARRSPGRSYICTCRHEPGKRMRGCKASLSGSPWMNWALVHAPHAGWTSLGGARAESPCCLVLHVFVRSKAPVCPYALYKQIESCTQETEIPVPVTASAAHPWRRFRLGIDNELNCMTKVSLAWGSGMGQGRDFVMPSR